MTSLSRFEHGFLEALYQSQDIGLALVDRDLRYVRVNQTLAEINGVPAADHEGRTMREILPDFAGMLEPLVQSVIEKREPIADLKVSGPTPANPEADRHFRGGYYPIFDGDDVIGVGALIVEVTESVRSQRELTSQAHEIYESVVQNLAVAQLALDQRDEQMAYDALQRALGQAKHIASAVLLPEITGDE